MLEWNRMLQTANVIGGGEVKRSIPILLFLLYVLPTAVSAHTGLEQATPAEGKTVTEELTEIRLAFNTELEFGSTFYVENEAGSEVPIRVEVTGQEMTGVLPSDLQDGEYTVIWEIIGVDGHPIKGEYAFTVDNQQEPEPAESIQANQPVDEASEEAMEEESELTKTETSGTESAASAGESQENASSSFVLIVLLAFLVIIGGTGFWLVRRGKTE